MRFPNGYGSIVYLGKRRRRPYAVRVTTGWNNNHKQQFRYLGYFEKKAEAINFLSDYNRNPNQIINKKTTLKEVYDLWSESHFNNVSLNTKRSYMTSFKKCEHLYNEPISELKTMHFQRIVDEMQSKQTARAFRNVIKMIFEYALKNDIVDKEYSSFIVLPKSKNRYVNKPFTKDEINLLWEHQGKEAADVLLILLYSGMRIGELLEMEIENINLQERYMIGGVKTEASINRIIPIHKKIVPLIEKRLLNEKYLFQSRLGSSYHYSSMQLHINKFFDVYKMDHITHETRHTFISQADRIGINKVAIKRIVGHSISKDITDDVYTHKNKDDLIQAIDLFDY